MLVAAVKKYICATPGANLLKIRLGRQIKIEHYPYKQEFSIGDIKVSLHPAGHILGSAQVRIQRNQEVWVLSGDYKT
jgi:putative mRNA 3-end processing factor